MWNCGSGAAVQVSNGIQKAGSSNSSGPAQKKNRLGPQLQDHHQQPPPNTKQQRAHGRQLSSRRHYTPLLTTTAAHLGSIKPKPAGVLRHLQRQAQSFSQLQAARHAANNAHQARDGHQMYTDDSVGATAGTVPLLVAARIRGHGPWPWPGPTTNLDPRMSSLSWSPPGPSLHHPLRPA